MLFSSIPEETSSVETTASARMSSSKRVFFSVVMFVLLFGTARDGVAATDVTSSKGKLAESYGKVPLSFEPNRGQTDARVQFLSRGPGYGIFLTPGEAVLSFNKDKAAGQSVLQMKLVGANTGAAANAEEKLPGTANYMKGSDPSKWATKVPTYQKVRYTGVYPGVDLVFYGNQRQLEYDFVVAPRQDAGKIALEFAGATPVVDAAGDLVLGAKGVDANGEAKFKKPVVYQMLGGERVTVAGAYEVRGQRVRFKLGKYDHSRELVIDPVVTYLTYLGGSGTDSITAIAVDSSGATYLTGTTTSTDFPLKGAAGSTIPSGDSAIFVTKLNQSGTSIVYSTYLASHGNTNGTGIAVDSSGSAYVVGGTDTDGFPVTSGAFQTLCGGNHDASGTRTNGCTGAGQGDNGGVLAKLSADGASIVYATYLGGDNFNVINAVAVDATGEAYVTGQTNAYCGPGPYSGSGYEPFQCFPTTNGSPQSATSTGGGGTHNYAFFTKLDAAGANLVYSGILGPDPAGPNQTVYGTAVAVSSTGVGFITGKGGNTLYTTDGSLQSVGSASGSSAFVAAFDPAAQQLLYSTYLGGPQPGPNDVGYGIAADANNNAYVAGATHDCDFPTTTGAYATQARYAKTDTAHVSDCDTGFVAKLNPSGSALVWATYLGDAPLANDNNAQLAALALGSDNSVYVAGAVQGSNYPVLNQILPQGNFNNVAVVSHLSADGSSLLFSSTVGGPAQATEVATAVAVDSAGAIYMAGNTNEPYLPTTNNVVQSGYAGSNDGFIAKISPSTPPAPNNGLTTNLLANPGAELGSLADWTIGGNGTPQVDTGTFDAGINPHTGSYDFVGGHDSNSDSLSQTVSIITQGITAAQVDGGTLFANVSFWEQGLNKAATDSAYVALSFLDANGAAMGNPVTTSTVNSHDGTWANVTGTFAIPVATRSITYTMNFVKRVDEPTNLDAFIDDNVLSIHTNTGLTLFPSQLHFGNVPVGSTSAAQTATVTNQQTTTINIQQILSELGSNPSDFLESDNCPSTGALVAGASCTLTITFVPDGVGAKSAGIAINTDSVPALQQVAVDGTGTGGILQVNPGNLKTIAGIGVAGTTGNGGPAIMAELNQPNGVAFDPSGNLYIADTPANVVRKVDTSGNITTFAGVGTGGFNGDGGLATAAELSIPFSVASDKNGNIYIQDTGNYVIRRVDATTGIITTTAGTPGIPGRSGDGGPATAAKLNENQGARFDSAGNFYVALCPTGSIRKIDTEGVITTVAGTPGTSGFSGDGGAATAAQLQCPSGVTIDAAGNFYIADEFNQVIRKVNTAGVISTIAGTPGAAGFSGDGGAATSATFNNPNDVVIDSLGNLYVADSGNNRVRKIDVNGVITTAAGGLNNAGSAAVNTPLAVTVDTLNNVYFSDSGNSKIEEIFPRGTQPFPATQVGTTSSPQSLTLSNIGNVAVTLGTDGAFTTSGNAGDFSLSPGTCGGGAVLAANGGSCALSISFTPTAVGQRVLTVGITDNALNTPQSFSIGGLGETQAGQTGTPVITWATPAAITTATPLSGTQLDATAADSNGNALAGTFAYTPAAGTLLAAGTQTLSVTFTPNDIADFTTTTKTVQIVVTQFVAATTATTLAVTSGGNAVTTIASGAVVTLTASVTAGVNSVAPGQVAFCDATAVSCTDIHLLGTAELVGGDSTSTATYKFVPGIGAHSYKAVFLGTKAYVGSASGAAALAVTGKYATTTVLASTGVEGSYALTATVDGFGLGSPSGNVLFTDTSTNGTLGTVPVTGVVRSFVAGTPISAGSSPNQVVPADVNGDGKPDLVLGNQSGTMLTVLIGNGDGTYNALPSFGTNYDGISGIAVADFNGDGKLDIATANGSTVGIFLGNGDGTFGAEQDFSNTSGSKGVYAADFNGDGKLDLAVTDNNFGITILIGNGDGTFTQPNAVIATGNGPNFQVVVADFNKDGNLDIAYGNYFDNTVGVLMGNGDGTFQAQTTFAVGAAPRSSFLGDFNGDGNPDIVVLNGNAASVSVLLGNGDGTFQAQQTYAVGSNPARASVGDLNGDGKLDIAVANENDGTLSILFGNGDGTFQTQQALTSGTNPDDVAIKDVNGDGSPDLEAVNLGDNTVTVFLNQATAAVPLTGITLAGTGSDTVVATYSGDTVFTGSTSNTLNLPSNQIVAPIITWTPTVATITYGTALRASQLNATAATAAGVAIPGTFAYTPAAGAVLTTGTQILSVTFTPTSNLYSVATASATITVSQFTPLLTWATPAAITTTTPLSSTQLDAAATDVNGAAVPGTYVYTPAAGTLLTAGTQTLSVTFTPTDTVDYVGPVSTTRSLVVTQAVAVATTTGLAVTSGGSPVTTVAAGAAVTLTATVTAGTALVSPGQVAFCDATALNCTGSHLLAVAQVTVAGTATYSFVPGIGAHSYVAEFLGTTAYDGSSSNPAALAVTGTYATATTIAQSGVPGNYSLTATTVGSAPYAVQAATQSVTINLGQSAQNYVLTGTGPSTINGSTYGNYYNTQGSCVTAGSKTTCDLTGAFTSSTPAYAAGTYDLQTVFSGSASSSVTSQTESPVGTNEPNDFNYSAFASNTSMTLKLNVTGGGSYSIPLIADGNYVPSLDSLGFGYTSTVCGGTPLGTVPCQQDYIGTVVGATFSGPVTGSVEFEMPSLPRLAGPTGTVSFLDTSNANALLGSSALGALTPGFALVPATGSPVTVGARPYGVATGDFNGDGFADVVTENYGAGTVSVLLGKGDGTFQAQVTYAVGAEPERVLVADMNGDGKLDLVVANTGSGTIGILLGKGDGTFLAQTTYRCSSPVGLGVMDINHDGIPDVVADDYYSNTMSVLLGNGDGTLKAAGTYATGGTPQTLAEGDFDGDGNVDVVVGNESGATVGVFLGNGDGTFQTMVTYPVGNSPQGLQVGDFNADGRQDLAVTNHNDGTISVLLGNGDGTFQTQVTYPVTMEPVEIAIADFNGDGIEDITVGNTGTTLTQGVLLGKGDGTFQTQVAFPTGNFPYGVAVADFNGDGLPDMAVTNFNDGTATVLLSQATETATATVTGISIAGSTTDQVVASYPGDAKYTKSVSAGTALIGVTIAPVITWKPAIASVVYGTALGASELNATAATAAGVAIPGTFAYSPAAGAVLGAGPQTLSVTFTPSSTAYSVATGSSTITVTQATPVITWAAPAGIAYGTPLSATQLDATVAGVSAGALPGTLMYTPALGTVLTPGTQTLSVAFTPTDAVDYTTASASVQIVVGGLALTSFTPTAAVLGSASTTITLTGTGFVATSAVQANGTALATTYVNATTLTAVIPATVLTKAGTVQITVTNPSIAASTPAQAFTVVPVATSATLSGPPTTPPGSQPSVTLSVTNPYPLALTAEFSLSFASAGSTPVDDPAIQFSNGSRSFSYVVAANSTSVPPVELQAGTDAGTITIAVKLTADGLDVTPTTLAPLVIVVPAVVPVLSGTTVTRSGDTLTVVIHGFSNTREVSSAVFDFTAATGDTLATPSLTIPATTIFSTWYTDSASVAYGSTFTYTQIFNTSGDAGTVGSVKVTLTNSVGASLVSTSP